MIGRGVIGATASLSWDETKDHTFELISYRKKSCWKTPRWVDDESVKKMDQLFSSTFNNFDYENKYKLLSPYTFFLPDNQDIASSFFHNSLGY